MKAELFFEAMSEIDTRYIEEALGYKKEAHRPVWIKWGAVAACLVLIAVLAVVLAQNLSLRNKTDVATLADGTQIVFVRSETTISSIDLGLEPTTRQLTEEEVEDLFAGLPVTAHAIITDDDEVVGLEGYIGDAKFVISTTDIPLLDTEVIGSEEVSMVSGVSVTAGYLVTDKNSAGERSVIYFATFKLGDNIIYVEDHGLQTESETIKNDLATIIQELIDNGEVDLSAISG